MNGSTHELSSVRPPDMLNSILTVGGWHGSSAVPAALNSGSHLVIGSSSESAPRSRARSAAHATKLLDMEAMGNTVFSSGTSPASFTTPNPAEWSSPSGPTSPYTRPRAWPAAVYWPNNASNSVSIGTGMLSFDMQFSFLRCGGPLTRQWPRLVLPVERTRDHTDHGTLTSAG